VRPWILGALALSLGLGVIGGAGLLIRASQLVQGSPVPEGEPTQRAFLTVRQAESRRHRRQTVRGCEQKTPRC
jgi:hypothetical protein